MSHALTRRLTAIYRQSSTVLNINKAGRMQPSPKRSAAASPSPAINLIEVVMRMGAKWISSEEQRAHKNLQLKMLACDPSITRK